MSGSLVATRHLSNWETKWAAERAGAWPGMEHSHDSACTIFRRDIRLVEDNYGELIEVPTC
ncbi:hypothetical protein [Comamonas sp.]|uniref:hypothetical protein n=1 Tax=Comamonas sp. TaxID=34028 RepID=UPI003A8EA868